MQNEYVCGRQYLLKPLISNVNCSAAVIISNAIAGLIEPSFFINIIVAVVTIVTIVTIVMIEG